MVAMPTPGAAVRLSSLLKTWAQAAGRRTAAWGTAEVPTWRRAPRWSSMLKTRGGFAEISSRRAECRWPETERRATVPVLEAGRGLRGRTTSPSEPPERRWVRCWLWWTMTEAWGWRTRVWRTEMHPPGPSASRSIGQRSERGARARRRRPPKPRRCRFAPEAEMLLAPAVHSASAAGLQAHGARSGAEEIRTAGEPLLEELARPRPRRLPAES